MSKVVATNAEVIKIHAIMKDHLSLAPNNTEYLYDEGWSDERVAKEVGRINANHVERIRLDMFGKLWTKTQEETNQIVIRQTMDAMEHNITVLFGEVKKLQEQVDALIIRTNHH